VNLIKEEYAAYEDAGAILNAFLDWREGTVEVPFASLLAYKPEDVALAAMCQIHEIRLGRLEALLLQEFAQEDRQHQRPPAAGTSLVAPVPVT
jgi:hypothetical protein